MNHCSSGDLKNTRVVIEYITEDGRVLRVDRSVVHSADGGQEWMARAVSETGKRIAKAAV